MVLRQVDVTLRFKLESTLEIKKQRQNQRSGDKMLKAVGKVHKCEFDAQNGVCLIAA